MTVVVKCGGGGVSTRGHALDFNLEEHCKNQLKQNVAQAVLELHHDPEPKAENLPPCSSLWVTYVCSAWWHL